MTIGPITETRENGTTFPEGLLLDELLNLPISRTVCITWERDGQTYWIEHESGLLFEVVADRKFVAVKLRKDTTPDCIVLFNDKAEQVWIAQMEIEIAGQKRPIKYGWFDTRPYNGPPVVGAIVETLEDYHQHRVVVDLTSGKILDVFEYR